MVSFKCLPGEQKGAKNKKQINAGLTDAGEIQTGEQVYADKAHMGQQYEEYREPSQAIQGFNSQYR